MLSVMENTMKQIEIKITTKSPIVITSKDSSQNLTQSSDFISGTLLRGALAEKYINMMPKGAVPHEDPLFKDLFLGGLRFIDAYRVIDNTRAFPLPKSLMKSKKTKVVYDLTKNDPAVGCKTISGYGIVKNNEIISQEINKTMHFHMSRNSEKERFAGKSMDGGVYTYESINSGTDFIGYILGDDRLISYLEKELFGGKPEIDLRIGRSKRTGYGITTFSIQPVKDIVNQDELKQSIDSGTIIFRLDTPLISSYSNTSIEQKPSLIEILNKSVVEPLVKVFPNKKIKINHNNVFGGMEQIINFIGVWGIYNIEMSAVERGTVFSISCDTQWDATELKTLTSCILSGFGLRTNEGFGQVRIWTPSNQYSQTTKTGSMIDVGDSSITKDSLGINSICQTTRDIVKEILNTNESEIVKKHAYKDVQLCKSQLYYVDNHTLSRLESYAKKLSDGCTEEVKEELERIFMASWGVAGLVIYNEESKKSEDVFQLYTNKLLPSWVSTVTPESKELGDTLKIKVKRSFKDYWSWFFRYARKIERTEACDYE